MSEEHPPPVEIINVEAEEASTVSSGADPAPAHAWIRTGALIIGALTLLWIGVSAAGIRTANEKQICFIELQTAMFSPGPGQSQGEIGSRFVDRAEGCGLPLLAESIRQNYEEEE